MAAWHEQLLELLGTLGEHSVDAVAYDTAWAALLRDPADARRPAFPCALEWLRDHQLPDGSWGSAIPYYRDRLISTTVVCAALNQWKDDARAGAPLERGIAALPRWHNLLGRDECDLVGFEMLYPTLQRRASELGLLATDGQTEHYVRVRAMKLAKIPPALLYTHNTAMFSMEFLGDDLDTTRAGNVLCGNGSVMSSPAATAYLLGKQPDNAAAWEYLQRLSARCGGGLPAIDPIDVFEPAWTIYSALLAECSPAAVRARVMPVAERIARHWGPEGIGSNVGILPSDLDDSAVAYRALTALGIELDPHALLTYEETDHFRNFAFERDPSVTAHMHLLDVLNHCYTGLPRSEQQRIVTKLVQFLARARVLEMFFMDKYHTSPYYATSHAVLAMHDYQAELAHDALYWIINTQNADGSWGYFDAGTGTVEETAYCLQALLVCKRDGEAIDRTVVARGVDYLLACEERAPRRYPALWIGKSLYTPGNVVRAAALSALALYDNVYG